MNSVETASPETSPAPDVLASDDDADSEYYIVSIPTNNNDLITIYYCQ